MSVRFWPSAHKLYCSFSVREVRLCVRNCSNCLLEKPLSDFYIRRTGKRTGEYYNHCKECQKSRGRTYYANNHERQSKLSISRNRKNRKKQRDFVNTLKNFPCVDCGNIYPPCVMDFDHRGEVEKTGNIGSLVSQAYFTIERLKKEIEKCDLVCANCHRIRTYNRKTKTVVLLPV